MPNHRTSRPPKKYTDRSRTQFTKEWQAWHDQAVVDAMSHERDLNVMSVFKYEADNYFPEDFGKEIPEEGAWILVIDVPPAYLAGGFEVPPLSMWRARSHTLNNGRITTGAGLQVYPKQALITTPTGELHLWPREYTICKDPMVILSDPDTEIHSLGGEPVLDEDQMFYLMSRGISKADATMLLIEQVKSTDFIYVTMPDYAVQALYGAGQSLKIHMAQNPHHP